MSRTSCFTSCWIDWRGRGFDRAISVNRGTAARQCRAKVMAKANALTPDPATALCAPVDGGESDGQPGEGATSNDVDAA